MNCSQNQANLANSFASSIIQADNEGVPCYIISPEGLDREIKPGILHSNWKTFIEIHFGK